MRTLKKTLSLLLAVALVLSLTVVGASAAYTGNKVDTLKDAADVGADYSEAVGVMVGLGIIEGYDDGTLRPETTYTREQAAKIIAYMQLGPKDAESLRCTKAPFTDVAADRWSAGYIAYCVEQGIIDGMGDGTFQPEAQLTGYQWAKMLLCAVGYGRNDEMGFLGSTFIDKTYLATYVCILLFVILSIILYKTRFGLRLRACGENPQAADSLGINVYKMRYAGTTISGALAGMGGFVYALTTANCTSNGDVAGFGFLALAVMIFGNWKPLNIAGGALLFGLFKCIAAAYSTIDINGDGVFTLANIGVSANFYRMLPYLITLIVLAFTSKNSRAPKAEGIPYDKGKR